MVIYNYFIFNSLITVEVKYFSYVSLLICVCELSVRFFTHLSKVPLLHIDLKKSLIMLINPL